MARDHAVYRPRHAEASVLHLVVRQHLEDFLHAAGNRANGAGLPEFIAREFREFLTCGVLAYGFARVRCRSCAFERLVPFSCKGRGFCPSCGGRRMTERAAHLVDEVLPPVPVRQWVLTLPYRLRYLLAWDHGLARAVLAVYARTLLEYYRRQAHSHGIRDGRTGTVTVIQRFDPGRRLPWPAGRRQLYGSPKGRVSWASRSGDTENAGSGPSRAPGSPRCARIR